MLQFLDSLNSIQKRGKNIAQEVAESAVKLFDLGPWIISGIALIQVWVIALLKRIKKPVVEIYESSNIEVGFSGFGPTLALTGTICVLHKDVFIKSIQAKANKKKDSSCHLFNWRALRSNTIFLHPSNPPPVEVASSFFLTQSNPFKYNIFFVDEIFNAEISPKVAQVATKWNDFRKRRLQELENKLQKDISTLLQNPVLESTIYDEFSKAGEMTEEYTIIDRACYWEAGDYQLNIIVESSKPNKWFIKTVEFTLSEKEAKLLRLNSIGILRHLCSFNVTCIVHARSINIDNNFEQLPKTDIINAIVFRIPLSLVVKSQFKMSKTSKLHKPKVTFIFFSTQFSEKPVIENLSLCDISLLAC